jgi:HAD superfamily hydrolase (TIGR01509 family)
MFDEFLRQRDGDGFKPFDQDDYDRYVDGKPRTDGVRSFVESRGIDLSDDEVAELGNRKNKLVLKLIDEQGVDAYEGSVRYVKAAIEAGLRRAVVSSSTNCKAVLKAAGIDDLFETIVDGHVTEGEGLKGKPAPDTFLEGAKMLGVEPAQAVVFEDALAGVEAGRAGKFGYVVGVDRVGQAKELAEHGADVVVEDLAELLEAEK